MMYNSSEKLVVIELRFVLEINSFAAFFIESVSLTRNLLFNFWERSPLL